jgi:hypothetical protein
LEDQITIGASGEVPHKQNRRDPRWLLQARTGRVGHTMIQKNASENLGLFVLAKDRQEL